MLQVLNWYIFSPICPPVDADLAPVSWVSVVPSEGEIRKVDVKECHQQNVQDDTQEKVVETIRSKHLMPKNNCWEKSTCYFQ